MVQWSEKRAVKQAPYVPAKGVRVDDLSGVKMSITGYTGQSQESLRAEIAARRTMLSPDPIEKERLVLVRSDPRRGDTYIDVLPFVRGY
jgi:hypothetical protein